MTLTKLLWVCTCVFMIFLSLCFLRLLNILGSEVDILIRWVSAISLILLGVFVGVFISKKQMQVRAMLIPFLLFALGFLAAPFVVVGVLMLVENTFSIRINPLIFGMSIAVYLLLYMGLWFWLKRKGRVKFRNNEQFTILTADRYQFDSFNRRFISMVPKIKAKQRCVF